MSEPIWTAQPYQRDHGQSIAICEGSEIICLIRPLKAADRPQAMQRAALIAAAPEMLNALMEVVNQTESGEGITVGLLKSINDILRQAVT